MAAMMMVWDQSRPELNTNPTGHNPGKQRKQMDSLMRRANRAWLSELEKSTEKGPEHAAKIDAAKEALKPKVRKRGRS